MSNFTAIDSTATDWWSFANMTKDYGMLALYTVALVTQIMSTFGISPAINTLVMNYGVIGLGSVLGLVYSIFIFLAYNRCVSSLNTLSAESATNPSALGDILTAYDQLGMDFAGALGVFAMIWATYGSNLPLMRAAAVKDEMKSEKPEKVEEEKELIVMF